jgi:hypothetical protein
MEAANDESNLRLVRERIGLLGKYTRAHVQGNQCVGLRYHLAHTDSRVGDDCSVATKTNPPINKLAVNPHDP